MDDPYGYCGMPCALCSRYRAEGKSRCPGCSADGYYTDGCRAHRCCKERGLEHCGSCPAYPCERLGRMADFRDLNTGHAKERTCDAVRETGFAAWYAAYRERADLLTVALTQYNDGRMKRFLCELFLQRELPELRELLRRAEGLTGDRKEKGKAFRQLAERVLSGDATDPKTEGVGI